MAAGSLISRHTEVIEETIGEPSFAGTASSWRAGESVVCWRLESAQMACTAFIGNRLTDLIRDLSVSTSVHLFSSCGGGRVSV